jgi:hypothetical protein
MWDSPVHASLRAGLQRSMAPAADGAKKKDVASAPPVHRPRPSTCSTSAYHVLNSPPQPPMRLILPATAPQLSIRTPTTSICASKCRLLGEWLVSAYQSTLSGEKKVSRIDSTDPGLQGSAKKNIRSTVRSARRGKDRTKGGSSPDGEKELHWERNKREKYFDEQIMSVASSSTISANLCA